MPFAKLNVSDEPPEYFAKLDPQIGNALVSMIDTLLSHTDGKKNLPSNDHLIEVQTLQTTIDKHIDTIEKLNKEIKNRDNTIKHVTNEHDNKVDDLNNRLSLLTKQWEQSKKSCSEYKESMLSLEKKLEESTISYNKKINELKIAHERVLEKSLAEQAAAMESTNNITKQQLHLQLEELTASYNSNLDSYKTSHSKDLHKLQTTINEYKNDIDHLNNEIKDKDNTIKCMISKHATLVDELTNQYNLEVKSKEHYNALYNKACSHQEELNAIHEQAILTITAKLESKFANELSVIQSECKTKIDSINNSHKQQLEEQYKIYSASLDSHETLFDKEITSYKSIIESYKLDIQNVKNEIASKDIQYNKRLAEIDTAHREQLLNIDLNHRNQLSEIETTYRERLYDTESKYNDKITKMEITFKEQLSSVDSKYNEQLSKIESMYKDQIINLQSTISDKDKLYQSTSSSSIMQLQSQLTDKLDLLNTRITPLVKPYEGTNKQRGDNGEALVYEYLFATFKSAIIKDVSGNAHQGDIYFVLNNIKCLFEIKNEVKISLGDIEKFKRDVAERSDQLAINCAVFVSLQSGRFPGKPNEELCIDVEKGIPVVYIYLLPNQLSILNYAIYYLQNLLSTKKIEEETSHALVTNVNSYHSIVCFMKDNLDKILSTIRKLDTLAVKGLSMAEKEEPIAKNNYLKYCSSFIVTDNKSIEHKESKEEREEVKGQSNTLMDYLPKDHEQAKLALARTYCKILFSGKWSFKNRKVIIKQDLCNPFGITEEQLNTYGTLESIEALAKQTYLDDIFTENKIKTYKDLISDPTFRRPTGQALSKFYINALGIDDSTVKKLRVILNNKSPIAQVVQYLNTRIAAAPPT